MYSDTGAVILAHNAMMEKLNTRISTLNRLKSKLFDEANIDSLTGLYNRRYFDQNFKKEWRLASRNQQSISLLMIDIDYFKNYNDRYGHQMGDKCLIEVAEILAAALSRPADFVARYGGEEFIIVLPYTDAAGAEVVARLIHKLLGERKIPHEKSLVENQLTVSIGVAALIPGSDLSSSNLLEEADMALYQAKKSGRNRTSYAPSKDGNLKTDQAG